MCMNFGGVSVQGRVLNFCGFAVLLSCLALLCHYCYVCWYQSHNWF